jgi:hypothetical protein
MGGGPGAVNLGNGQAWLGTLLASMTLLLHGEAGGWDELLIALVAFGVLWIAVKLAGRKSAEDDGDQADPTVDVDEEHRDPAQPPATKLG